MKRQIARALVVALLAAPLTLLGSAASMAAPSSTFTNPLVNGYGADPSMVYHEGNYYLLYNQGVSGDFKMKTASSIAGLRGAPNVTVFSATSDTGCCNVGWGGFLHEYNDRWYIYGYGDDGTWGVNPRQYVLESTGDDPLGPYVFKDDFAGPGPNAAGYAVNTFVVGAQRYALSTRVGNATNDVNDLWIATMSNPWTLSSSWSLLASPSNAWECAGGKCIAEGGSVYVRNGKVFLLYSAGAFESPDYCSGLLTASASSNLLSSASWTKSSGCALSRNNSVGSYGPGSTTWFDAPNGDPWIIYHVKTTTSSPIGGEDRRLQAASVTFDGSGNPVFAAPTAINTWTTLPGGDQGIETVEAEDGSVANATVKSSPFASGGEFVGNIDYSSSSVSIPLTVPVYARYVVRVYYANQSGASATHSVSVNGGTATTLSYPASGSWGAFAPERYVTMDPILLAGSNTIQFTKGTNWAEIDRIEVAQYRWEAEAQQVTDADRRSSGSASAGRYVGGIDYGTSSVFFRAVSVEAPSGTYRLRFYYANNSGASATWGLKVNGVSQAAVSLPHTGSWGAFSTSNWVDVYVSLNSGSNTIEVTKGSNWAELDALLVI